MTEPTIGTHEWHLFKLGETLRWLRDQSHPIDKAHRTLMTMDMHDTYMFARAHPTKLARQPLGRPLGALEDPAHG